MKFDIIVATDAENGIGKDGRMPWDIPADFTYFHKKTSESGNPNKINAVIMGRITWESIPNDHRPLKNRYNIVISETLTQDQINFKVITSLEKALKYCAINEKINQIFIIGGLSLYEIAINLPELRYIYQTKINAVYYCDRIFPKIKELQPILLKDHPNPSRNNTNHKLSLSWVHQYQYF